MTKHRSCSNSMFPTALAAGSPGSSPVSGESTPPHLALRRSGLALRVLTRPPLCVGRGERARSLSLPLLTGLPRYQTGAPLGQPHLTPVTCWHPCLYTQSFGGEGLKVNLGSSSAVHGVVHSPLTCAQGGLSVTGRSSGAKAPHRDPTAGSPGPGPACRRKC